MLLRQSERIFLPKGFIFTFIDMLILYKIKNWFFGVKLFYNIKSKNLIKKIYSIFNYNMSYF
jgi:hypothetical protein